MKCGLLGRTLSHSYSPLIHSNFGNYSYVLFEKEPEELEDFLRFGDFQGLNVTMPYKKDVIPYLDQISETAQKLGAVNTIIKSKDGKLVGHNTDYYGFYSMVQKSGLDVRGKKVLVLGSGGAAVTVVTVLRELSANVIMVSRTGENNYHNLNQHTDASVIVNATPVGMYPNTGVSSINLMLFPALEGVLDIVYNPARTQLLLDAENMGLITENGLWMLIAQAKESAEWFLNASLPDNDIPRVYQILKSKMENIVLIGMPGCGKSTVGKHLSEIMGKKFVDTDFEIEKTAGISIPEIFVQFGEEGFRKIETEVLKSIGKESGLIIATGGGCVTKEVNYPLLHQNGRIIWLQRDLRLLPTDGRPLSQTASLLNMYQVREPMYRAFADHIIPNDATPQKAAEAILSLED